VRQVLQAARAVTGVDIPVRLAPRRAGDSPRLVGDATRAKALLGWRAVRGIDEMCADHWRWQSGNPDGYGEADG
jgi:UDP-glucose 4-epimerase